MLNGKRVLAIIPARGGSKRLPKKNILPLGGKPLIGWTIEVAQSSQNISTVMVSTDCSEIATISESFGAEVPYLRSAKLSNGHASSVDVVLDAINFYETQGEKFEYILLLQPTSPLRTSKDIDNAMDMLNSKAATGIISVVECEHSPLWCNTLPNDNSFYGFIPKKVMTKRSQDLESYYRINGAIYLIETTYFKEVKNFFNGPDIYAYIMEKSHSVDIDDEFDFKLAESLINVIK